MTGITKSHYQLVAGPYRALVYEILARFKMEFSYAFVERTMIKGPGIQRTAISVAGTLALFDQTRSNYESCLAESIGRLQVAGGIEGHSIDAEEAAIVRTAQIRKYLDATRRAWERLADTPTRAAAINAVSESFWPYYCVAYLPKNNNEDLNPYFATWVAQRELFRRPLSMRANIEEIDEHDPELLLCPSIRQAIQPNCGTIGQLIDLAGKAPLDFDRIETNVGHVQVLRGAYEPSLILDTDILSQIVADLPEDPVSRNELICQRIDNARSAFTDLFYFVNHAARKVLHADDGSPIGVVFLATPHISCLTAPLADDEEQARVALQDLMEEAWARCGGGTFARVFRRDFDNLRREFAGWESVTRSDAKNIARIDIVHTSKNMLNNISSLLERALLTENKAQQMDILLTAQQVAYFLGQDFGLEERLLDGFQGKSAQSTQNLISGLSNDELEGLLTLLFQWMLLARHVQDAGHGRIYTLNGNRVANIRTMIEVLDELSKVLRGIYSTRGLLDAVTRIDDSVRPSLEKDSIIPPLYFACRELVDNMRPRKKQDRNRDVVVEFLSAPHLSHGTWRAFLLTQRTSGEERESPFDNASRAESVKRFNQRFGDGMQLTKIKMHIPRYDGKLRQHVLEATLFFPYVSQAEGGG